MADKLAALTEWSVNDHKKIIHVTLVLRPEGYEKYIKYSQAVFLMKKK